MPRNGAGQYTLPQAPFVPLQTISSAAVNSDFSDLADAMTGSLARDGQGGMTGVLPLANAGTNFVSDPDTGFVRVGANNPAIQAGGVNVLSATPTGVDIAGTLTRNGAFVGIPAGVMFPYGGATAPTGYLLCDGTAYSRTTYAALFAAIGTAYGTGDGTTTFNVPDCRGRVPAGKDNMGGTAANRLTTGGSGVDGATLGASGGVQSNTIGTTNLPPYTPSGFVNTSVTTTVSDLRMSTGNSPLSSSISPGSSTSGSFGSSNTVVTSAAVSSFAGNAQGGASTPMSNVQPTIVANYIIATGA